MTNKKLIFLDGDGTLWYPKDTKYAERPYWIYNDPKLWRQDPVRYLELMPTVKSTLKALHGRGIALVLISQQPLTEQTATYRLERLAEHFDIKKYLAAIRPSYAQSDGSAPRSKAVTITEVLRQERIPKARALLIGDSYNQDYLAAKASGISCLLIDAFKHTETDKRYLRVSNRITVLSEVLNAV